MKTALKIALAGALGVAAAAVMPQAASAQLIIGGDHEGHYTRDYWAYGYRPGFRAYEYDRAYRPAYRYSPRVYARDWPGYRVRGYHPAYRSGVYAYDPAFRPAYRSAYRYGYRFPAYDYDEDWYD